MLPPAPNPREFATHSGHGHTCSDTIKRYPRLPLVIAPRFILKHGVEEGVRQSIKVVVRVEEGLVLS